MPCVTERTASSAIYSRVSLINPPKANSGGCGGRAERECLPLQTGTWSGGSDPRVPGPAHRRDTVLAAIVEDILHHDALEIFPALVADLALHPQAQWGAV